MHKWPWNRFVQCSTHIFPSHNLQSHLLCGCIGLLFFMATSQTSFAQLVEANKATTAAADAWPSDWYVRDGEGLEEVRALEGKPAQELAVAEWRGESTTLAALKGKIVVLDFWATWCGPCLAAIPKNVQLVNEYKDKGVALIGVHDAKAGWEDVDQVISEKGINYPVALDKTEQDNGVNTKAYALKFWPTYFVIDRNGIVRGAAIKPDKVHEVVDRLLAESPAPAQNMVATKMESPPAWFLGGDKRLKSMREKEGQKGTRLVVANWVGKEPDRSDWSGRVRVIQFVRPEINASVDQLMKVQAVAERFARQGVVFLAVCDARSSQQKLQSIIDDKHIELPIAMDSNKGQAEPSIGATAQALGVKFSPTTVVVDRAGKVRAAGLKPDFLDKVINGLLAEPVSTVEEEKPLEDSVPKSEIIWAQRPDEGQPPAP